MSANIAYDRSANVYTVETDTGELILAIGHTHALKLLKAEPFKLTEVQARFAVTNAFAAIGATVSLATVKKMASANQVKMVAGNNIEEKVLISLDDIIGPNKERFLDILENKTGKGEFLKIYYEATGVKDGLIEITVTGEVGEE